VFTLAFSTFIYETLIAPVLIKDELITLILPVVALTVPEFTIFNCELSIDILAFIVGLSYNGIYHY